MKKLAVIASLFSSFLLIGFSSITFAREPNAHAQIPEQNGDYADPEHPGVRVRVFVHEPKEKAVATSSSLTCTDADSAAIVDPTGWHLPANVTYRLNVGSVPSSVSGVNFPQIAANAFGAWMAATSKVTFNRGANTTVNRNALDYQNIVSWGRTSGNALAVTYTRYYTATKEVADVDTIFNSKFVWNWTDPSANACSLYTNSYDAQNILVHEIGHWMGLADEYTTDYVDNTMFGYGAKAEVKKDTLTTGDKAKLPIIYP